MEEQEKHRESLETPRCKLHCASSVSGFVHGSQGHCAPILEQSITEEDRWMGSAAEGAPELEMGISRTPAVLHISCTLWHQVGHMHRVVLVLGSDGAFQEPSLEEEKLRKLQTQLLFGMKKKQSQ